MLCLSYKPTFLNIYNPNRVAFKIHFCLRENSIITGGREFASSRSIILALILLTILMLMLIAVPGDLNTQHKAVVAS